MSKKLTKAQREVVIGLRHQEEIVVEGGYPTLGEKFVPMAVFIQLKRLGIIEKSGVLPIIYTLTPHGKTIEI